MASGAYEFSLDPVPVPPVETAYRRIAGPIPAPGTREIYEEIRRYEPVSMSLELPLVWERAEGFNVEDRAGNRFLDFTSGIFVTNAGHANKRVVAAIEETVARPLLHTYSFPNEPRRRLVKKLVEVTPPQLDTVLLLTTGAETTEGAIKLMRLHGQRSRPDKLAIVSLSLGFHGKTMGSQTAGGRPEQKRWIGRLDPNFHQIPVPFPPACPFHDEDRECGADCFEKGMEQLIASGVDAATVAGFICEPYQGWSAGFLPNEFVQAMRAWADDHGALIAFDEVQSGIGRTGKLLAHEHFGVKADLACCGKGISSSLPLSAIVGRRELIDVDDSFHSTHGGNPVCCAAALANIEAIVDDGLVDAAAAMDAPMRARLHEIAASFPDQVLRITGRGAVWALHLGNAATGQLDGLLGDLVIERAMRRGVLCVRTGTGTIKLGPPLDMPIDAALEGADVIADAIADAIADRQQLAA
jgi:4-aminobutyrate aminotransferase-like enzyme